jgi:hypothetical protein
LVNLVKQVDFVDGRLEVVMDMNGTNVNLSMALPVDVMRKIADHTARTGDVSGRK